MNYKKYKAEALEQQRQLKLKVADNHFLVEWLTDFEAGLAGYEQEKLSPEAVEQRAEEAGYRSGRIGEDHFRRVHLVMQRFVSAKAFIRLWDILKRDDLVSGGFSYSPANGGFPSRILRAIEDWYRLPKFTAAERKAHQKKIEKLSDELLLLLGQVAYSTNTDTAFSQFSNLTQEQISSLFGWFKSPKKWTREFEYKQKNRAQFNLKSAGITPLWAVEYIQQASRQIDTGERLPTKVRAKGAMKTYLIHRLHRELESSLMFSTFKTEPLIPQDLFAEIVGLIADCDCSADDVRKALKQ